jgi:hypothetical protein
VTDWKADYVLRHTSGWRWIFTCVNCGDNTDSDEKGDVCSKCGHMKFARRIGRWHAYHRNLSLWRQLKMELGLAEEIPALRFDVELKDPTHD